MKNRKIKRILRIISLVMFLCVLAVFIAGMAYPQGYAHFSVSPIFFWIFFAVMIVLFIVSFFIKNDKKQP